MRAFLWFGLAGLTLALVRPALPEASGCAPAPPKGKYVDIAEESAIIIWDAKNKVEHFIRRAKFATDVYDFGFLVPSPTQPELNESSDGAFGRLEFLTRPEVKVQRVAIPRNTRAMTFEVAGAAPPKSAAVEVLEEKQVGGYDAVVLRADDAAKLNEWLGKHGYSARDDLTEWLEPYVKQKWIITAFKIAKGRKEAQSLATSAVRMTFKTDKPFYPYSEPSSQRDMAANRPRFHNSGRLLRVFLLADVRMDGALANGNGWGAFPVWSDRLSDKDRDDVLSQLKVDLKDAPSRLTEYEDRASPRPGTADLFFSESTDQSVVKRPPITRTEYYEVDEMAGTNWTPVLLVIAGVAGLGLIGLFVWTLMRNRAV